MARGIALIVAGCVAATAPIAASAQTGTSYQLVARGHYTTAISRLEERRRDHAATPEATLNLATAYAQTGNTTKARALYAEVLREPAVDLDLTNGATATSHQVAQRGLSLIGQTIATR